jgi:hypothetical protein
MMIRISDYESRVAGYECQAHSAESIAHGVHGEPVSGVRMELKPEQAVNVCQKTV